MRGIGLRRTVRSRARRRVESGGVRTRQAPMTTDPAPQSAAINRPQRLLVVCVLVERLLRSFDAGAEVSGSERGTRDEVPGSCAEPLHSTAVLHGPHVGVERGMSEQQASRRRCRQRGRGLVFTQPSLCFRHELCRGAQVDPVGVQRIPGVAMTDARRSEDATQPAHDHGDLCRRVAGRIVRPDDVGSAVRSSPDAPARCRAPARRGVPSCCRDRAQQSPPPRVRR